MKTKKKVFYGWWVSLAGGANMILSSGPTFQVTSTLFRAVEDEFGWSRALVSGVASFGRFGGALLGPLEGWMTDKIGSKSMILTGFLIGGIGLVLFSFINNATQYYLAFFLISLGFSIGGFTPSMVAVNAWMTQHKSTGMAMVIGGSSLSGIFVPLIVWGITNYGWRETFFIIGLITIVVGPFLAKVIGRRPPSYLYQTGSQETTNFIPQHDFTLSEAMKTRAFWALAITHGLTNISVGAISAHIYLHLSDGNGVNLSPYSSGFVLAIMAIFSFTFQILGGVLGDRVNKLAVLPIFIIIQAAALFVITFAKDINGAIIFAVLWGIGFGARTPIFHSLRGHYFGRKHFGTISGVMSFPMSMGMMATPVLVGWAFDVRGSYQFSFIVMAILCVVASLSVLFVKKPQIN